MLWKDFEPGLDTLLGIVQSYAQRVRHEGNSYQQTLMYIQLQDDRNRPRTWGAPAPNTTAGTALALTEAETSELRPLIRRLHSLVMKDDFLDWTFLLAIREANLPLKLHRVYISQCPFFWEWEHHHHLILTPDLRDLQMTTLLKPTWPTIFKSLARLAPNIEFLSLDGQTVIKWGREPSPGMDEHTLLSISALSQLKTLHLPSLSESLLMKLLPRFALLPKLEHLDSEHDSGLQKLELVPPLIGFPAFRSLHWGHSVTLLPHLFQSIQSPNFSSLLIIQRNPVVSFVLRDVLQHLTKLHGSTLMSFIYHISSLLWLNDRDVDESQGRITIHELQPLLDCRNLTTLKLMGHIEVRLLSDDIQKICDSLSKLQCFQAATDIADEDGNSLLTTIDLQPFSCLPDLEHLFIQFDGSDVTADELKGIPKSISKLRYFDVSSSVPPASAQDFVSAVRRMFPILDILSYETDSDSTGSDNDLFEDKQKPRDWYKVSSLLKRKRKI